HICSLTYVPMRITIFSRGPFLYSTRRLVEAGKARHHWTEVVDHGLCSPDLFGDRTSLLYHGKPLDLPQVAIPRIGATVTSRGVAIIRQLDALGVPHTMAAEGLLRARDKMGCLQVLTAHGLPVPRTVLCFSVGEARRAALQMDRFPVVVKLLESTHGMGVALAHSLYQLEAAVDGFLRTQGRVLLQEYVGESQGRDFRAFVVGDKVVAAMERQAGDGEFRANMHLGATARAVRLSPEDEELCLRAAAVTGVEIAGVDLIPSARGPLLMEVNASPGLEGIEGATKVDIAGAIIDYAVKKAKHE
ncbi:MAG: RimK family alpha-L-glutamate ligase, partial [Bacteroidota bacterium]